MAQKKLTFLLFSLAISFVVFYASPVTAAIVDCQCSGSNSVMIDSNNNGIPDDPYSWTVKYDDIAHVLIIEGNGGIYPIAGSNEAYLFNFSNPDNTLVFEERLDLDSYFSMHSWHQELFTGITAVRDPGAPTFNHWTINWLNNNDNENMDFPALQWNAGDTFFTGNLVDSNGDGIYDRAQGVFTLNVAHPWLPNLILDQPIQFYPPSGSPQYLVIPNVANIYTVSPFEHRGPFSLFVPMSGNAVTLACGANTLFTITLGAEAPPTPPVVIPTINQWGGFLLTLLLLAMGIRFLRKTGFGNTLTL